MHDDALRRHADLALMHEGTEDRGIHGSIDIRVVKHNERRLAAKFQQCGLQMLAAKLRDNLADLGGAGEVDATNCWMRDQRFDDPRRIFGCVGDDVDNPGRKAGLRQCGRDQPLRAGALLGGFQDDGVAAGDRHGDGACGENNRCIPGCDGKADTGRLTHTHGKRAGFV